MQVTVNNQSVEKGGTGTITYESNPLSEAERWPRATLLDDAEDARAQRSFPARVGLLLLGFHTHTHTHLMLVLYGRLTFQPACVFVG